MFYETIKLSERKVDSIEDAILLKGLPQPDRSIPVDLSGRAFTYEAISLDISGIKIYLVSDVHADDPPWAEVAIIVEDKGKRHQIESYTGRALGAPQLYEVIADYLMEEKQYVREAQLNFSLTGEEYAWFECGCCGMGFNGNVKEQLAYDQDSGFGICNNCSDYY